MRKGMLLIAVLLTIASLPSFSQVLKMRAFQSKVVLSYERVTDVRWESCNILVTVDSENEKVRVFSQTETSIDIIRVLPQRRTNDGTEYNFTGVDQDGKKLSVSLTVFTDQTYEHRATLVLSWSNVDAIYRLKTNN